MKPCSFARAATAVAVMLAAAGCGTAASEEAGAGPGQSDLAPTFQPDARGPSSGPSGGPTPARAAEDRADSAAKGSDTQAGTGKGPRGAGDQGDSGSQVPREGDAAQARDAAGHGASVAPGPVRVADEVGDLSVSTEGAPASADIVGVVMERTRDRVEVRTTFAGPVPSRQSGTKSMNVASFYDVDGNGYVDYEVWASLADNGWGTGYLDDRRNEASFGPSTGIEVSVHGDTLVVAFPWDRIGNAREYRWQAASEWGSYESMAASTSARDRAPDDGAVRYPG